MRENIELSEMSRSLSLFLCSNPTTFWGFRRSLGAFKKSAVIGHWRAVRRSTGAMSSRGTGISLEERSRVSYFCSLARVRRRRVRSPSSGGQRGVSDGDARFLTLTETRLSS